MAGGAPPAPSFWPKSTKSPPLPSNGPVTLTSCGCISGLDSCRDVSLSRLCAGILNLESCFWPGSIAAMLRICLTCSSGVVASLLSPLAFFHLHLVSAVIYTFALMIQSRSSSPSSGPPGPPFTALNKRGRQSKPSSARFAASCLCMSSISDL